MSVGAGDPGSTPKPAGTLRPRGVDAVSGSEVESESKKKRARTRPGLRAASRAIARNDELGKLIRAHTDYLLEHGWEALVRKVRGRGDLKVRGQARAHTAGPLIERIERDGVPVVIGTPPWSEATLDERIERGSHKSCDEYLDFLREEMLEFAQKGFWILLPYRIVKKIFPQLRLSPLGVVPQRNRRPRLIADYSYYGVNDETVKLAPAEAMQFGRALERILYNIRHANPKYGPVQLGKVDLADGFYRVGLSHSSAPKLGIAFPKYSEEEQMVAIPLVLPMGWTESPPWFSAVTETIADVANHWDPAEKVEPHPLEKLANTPPEEEEEDPTGGQATEGGGELRMPSAIRLHRRPVEETDIFVDDYIQQIQAPPARRLKHQRKLLHAIDSAFRPKDEKDTPYRKDVPSLKKLKKGDATLMTRKEVLGWIIDTIKETNCHLTAGSASQRSLTT